MDLSGAMGAARAYHAATLLSNGKVLVTGGWQLNSVYLATADLYDPATESWTATGALSVARLRPTTILLTNGMVLIAGGEGAADNLLPARNFTMSDWDSELLATTDRHD